MMFYRVCLVLIWVSCVVVLVGLFVPGYLSWRYNEKELACKDEGATYLSSEDRCVLHRRSKT